MSALDQLALLARLRSLKAAQRLVADERTVGALRAQADRLRDHPSPAPQTDLSEAAIRDRHRAWRSDQLRRTMTALARAEASAQPLREANARAKAREAVIAKLLEREGRRQLD